MVDLVNTYRKMIERALNGLPPESKESLDDQAVDLDHVEHQVKMRKRVHEEEEQAEEDDLPQAQDVPVSESAAQKAAVLKNGPVRHYSVGDVVHPKCGPHKGEPHKVIHVHGDGSMNIVPDVNMHAKNKYKLGAARCTDDQIDVPMNDNKTKSLAKQNTPKVDKKAEATAKSDKTGHVAVRNAEGKFAGRYKSEADAKKIHGNGATYHAIKVNEDFDMLAEEMPDFLPEAAKGPLHRINYSYETGDKSRASGTHKIHAPDKDRARSYASADLKHRPGLTIDRITALKEEEALEEGVKAKTMAHIEDNVHSFDDHTKHPDNSITFRRGFFYRHGQTSGGFADNISKQLDKAGVKHSVVDHEEKNTYKAFKGGASVRTQPHFAVRVKLHEDLNEEVLEEILAETKKLDFDTKERNRAIRKNQASDRKKDKDGFSRIGKSLQEVSSKLLDRYVSRASGEFGMAKNGERNAGSRAEREHFGREAQKRKSGIATAINKQDGPKRAERPQKVYAREEVTLDQIDEMSDAKLNDYVGAMGSKNADHPGVKKALKRLNKKKPVNEMSTSGLMRVAAASKPRAPKPEVEDEELNEEHSANFYVVNGETKVSGPHPSREQATTASINYIATQKDINVTEVGVARERLDEGRLSPTHHVHLKDAKGKPAGKVAISAVDHENAKWQGEQMAGKKPFRGMTVGAITRINEEGEPKAFKGLKRLKTKYEMQMDDAHRHIYSKPVLGKLAIKEEDQLDEGKAYVKPFGNSGWKSSDKSGHVKYWNEHGKASAHKHAGVELKEDEQLDELSTKTHQNYYKKAAAVGPHHSVPGIKDDLRSAQGDEKTALKRKLVNRKEGMNKTMNKISGAGKTLYEDAEQVDEARRGRPPKNAVAGRDEDEREHILMQLRKNVSMSKPVKFKDGSEHEQNGDHSSKVLSKYAGLSPKHKEVFQAHIDTSHANLKHALNWTPPAETVNRPTERPLDGKDARTVKKPLHRRPAPDDIELAARKDDRKALIRRIAMRHAAKKS